MKVFFFVMALFLSFLLSSCASPASYQGMIAAAAPAEQSNPKLQGAIMLGVETGGHRTNPALTSQVSNTAFKQALNDSLKSYGYLASSPQQAKYRLNAYLEQLDQSPPGMTFNVMSVVLYTLSISGTVVERYHVTAFGSASTSDAFVGETRLRIATERSIKTSIQALMDKLKLVKA
jgi:hypothetical protein